MADAPKTMGAAERLYKKGSGALTDADIFGDDTSANADASGAEGGTAGALDYLGHFANDDVTTQGHNVGHKAKGAVTSPGIAKRGYRCIPGTATHTQGHARFGDAATDLAPPRHVRDAMEKLQMTGPVPVSREPKMVSASPKVLKPGDPRKPKRKKK